jgi:hypothetical protein
MRRRRSWKRGSERRGSRIWVQRLEFAFHPWAQNQRQRRALLLFVKDGDVVDLLALRVRTGRCIG